MTTTNPRRPWGNGRIPALNCGQCGRQMDDDATYNVLRDRTPVLALCWACFPWTDVTAKHHARCYPDCPYPGWHEMDPHWVVPADRGAAWCRVNGVELPDVPVGLPAIFQGPWPPGPDADDDLSLVRDDS